MKRIIDFLDDIEAGQRTRENFEKLRNFLNSGLFTGSQFRIIEKKVENPSSEYIIAHGLPFRPKDCFITYVSNGTASINYSQITKDTISLNVSDQSTIRVIVGSFS